LFCQLSSMVMKMSALFLNKYNSLFETAKNRAIQPSDAPSLPSACASSVNGMDLSASWSPSLSQGDEQHSSSTQQTTSSSLVSALFHIYGRSLVLLGFLQAIYSVLAFVGPILLHSLVICAEESSACSISKISIYLSILIVSKLLVAILSTQYSYYSGELNVSIAAALKDCIFRKTLRLSTASKMEYSTGNISNLYTVSQSNN
jgi:ABC-type bacteriocin/lantibiotic exporter with double-glycine peptidase domain